MASGEVSSKYEYEFKQAYSVTASSFLADELRLIARANNTRITLLVQWVIIYDL